MIQPVAQHVSFMTLNKKKSAKSVSLLRLEPLNTWWWLSSSRSAKESAKVSGSLFSAKATGSPATLPEEPLASEIQMLLSSAASVIECATGGHGRCADSACRCRCHRSVARARAKRRMSI